MMKYGETDKHRVKYDEMGYMGGYIRMALRSSDIGSP